MVMKGGVREAARMLAGLEPEKRENILKKIAITNPEMAETLRRNMIVFEDLKLMTVKMLTEFLRDVQLDDIGLALRLASDELKDFFLNNVSTGMKDDLLEILNGPPKPKSQVLNSMDKVMSVALLKLERGELILRESDGEEYV